MVLHLGNNTLDKVEVGRKSNLARLNHKPGLMACRRRLRTTSGAMLVMMRTVSIVIIRELSATYESPITVPWGQKLTTLPVTP